MATWTPWLVACNMNTLPFGKISAMSLLGSYSQQDLMIIDNLNVKRRCSRIWYYVVYCLFLSYYPRIHESGSSSTCTISVGNWSGANYVALFECSFLCQFINIGRKWTLR